MSDQPDTTAPRSVEALADLAAIEAASREKLIPFWRYSGLQDDTPLCYPVSTQVVADLLHKCGYAADCDLILNWINSKLIPPPPIVSGKRSWYAAAILNIVANLESRRLWQPFHPLHQFKLNRFELMQAEAERAGHATGFHDLGGFDIPALLVMMQDAESRPLREALRCAILTKLRGEWL